VSGSDDTHARFSTSTSGLSMRLLTFCKQPTLTRTFLLLSSAVKIDDLLNSKCLLQVVCTAGSSKINISRPSAASSMVVKLQRGPYGTMPEASNNNGRTAWQEAKLVEGEDAPGLAVILAPGEEGCA